MGQRQTVNANNGGAKGTGSGAEGAWGSGGGAGGGLGAGKVHG